MDTKKFILPQCTVNLTSARLRERTGLVVAGGRTPCIKWLHQTAAGDVGAVYCADAGADSCLAAGIVPQLLCGDQDSAAASSYEQLAAMGTVIKIFTPEKDDTDLQLLLKYLQDDLLVSGIWGGRFDHLYSNVFSLLQYKLERQSSVILADEQEVMLLLSGGERALIELKELADVEAVSLLPLSAEAEVSLSGVYWPLKNSRQNMLYPYAVSNIPLEDFRCECLCGNIGLYLYFRK